MFVRLRGCHLRCHYCDTEYAFKEGGPMTLDEVIASGEAMSDGCPLWEVTGGEPLLQPAVLPLMERLCDLGKTVLLETSGACEIGDVDARVHRIVDLKTPGSGECDRNLWSNVEKLTKRDEVKFVLTDRRDYEWAMEQVERHGLTARCGAVLVSAAAAMSPGLEIAGTAGLAMEDLAAWLLEDRPAVVMQTQLHKHIWDPLARGV